jgi:hypothetical protein
MVLFCLKKMDFSEQRELIRGLSMGGLAAFS